MRRWGGRTYTHFIVVVDLWAKYLWVVPLTADRHRWVCERSPPTSLKIIRKTSKKGIGKQ
jgi:hypothetical protein